MPAPEPLGNDAITAALADLDGWTRQDDEITRTFSIEYHAGIPMIVEVARAAKELGHHPDILRRWDTLTFTVTTHDAGYKITQLDIDLAHRINTIATTTTQPRLPSGARQRHFHRPVARRRTRPRLALRSSGGRPGH